MSMKVIWLLGGDANARKQLERNLAPERTSVEYKVKRASSLADIPPEDLRKSSVTILADAFHPQYPGFEGLKAIRATGFPGPVYIFGEPAAELAVTPFRSLGL